MDGNKINLIKTDPPYAINYKSGHRDNGFEILENDDKILDFTFIMDMLENDSNAYIWTSHHKYPEWREMYSDYYKNTIIWNKSGGGMGDLDGDYGVNYEMCLFLAKGRKLLNGKRLAAVWNIKRDNPNTYIHPTQKPIVLFEIAIEKSSEFNDNVVDLFGGSGTCLIACEKLDRNCYMMELTSEYCEKIIRRYYDFTFTTNIKIIRGENVIEFDKIKDHLKLLNGTNKRGEIDEKQFRLF
jgi:DNA modification methylase